MDIEHDFRCVCSDCLDARRKHATRLANCAPILRRYCGSVYRLEHGRTGWLLHADSVCIGGPYDSRAAAMAALDAVAPIG